MQAMATWRDDILKSLEDDNLEEMGHTPATDLEHPDPTVSSDEYEEFEQYVDEVARVQSAADVDVSKLEESDAPECAAIWMVGLEQTAEQMQMPWSSAIVEFYTSQLAAKVMSCMNILQSIF